MFSRPGLCHIEEISPETASALEYCLTRMERYAPQDWELIRDLQPLLLALKRKVAR